MSQPTKRQSRQASCKDYKTLAGETYVIDDEDMGSSDVDIHMHANKHIHEVLSRTFQSSESMLQTIPKGKGDSLTAENLSNQNHPLSIHLPIIVKDTPLSIGMELPLPTSSKGRGEGCEKSAKNGNKNTAGSGKNEDGYVGISIRDIGAKIGMKQPISVMDVRNQDELEGWDFSDMVEYFEDEDRKFMGSNTPRRRSSRDENENLGEDANAVVDVNLATTKNPSPSSPTKDTSTPSRRSSNLPMTPSRTIKRTNIPRVLNQISLEFSLLPLAKYVKSPKFVRDIDWVDNMWPAQRKAQGDYPRVQYYCLTSTAGCYTDFHIDFGGTSVWYHVLNGRKVFLLIPPTANNVELYEAWLCRKDQNDIFFPDMKKRRKRAKVEAVSTSGDKETSSAKTKKATEEEYEDLKVDTCIRLTLEQGQTFIIPTGWIHAVYTPVDSIVFGGNFLHGFDIPGQLNIYCLETRTRVPAKFRFPSFAQLMFYAGSEYYKRKQQQHLNDGKNTNATIIVKEELSGLKILVGVLRQWAVNPGGTASRFGSVAHVIAECVASLSSYGVSTIEEMIDGLETNATPKSITTKSLPRLKLSMKKKAVTIKLHSVKKTPSRLHLGSTDYANQNVLALALGKDEMAQNKLSSPPLSASAPKVKFKLSRAPRPPPVAGDHFDQENVVAQNDLLEMGIEEEVDSNGGVPPLTFNIGSAIVTEPSLSISLSSGPIVPNYETSTVDAKTIRVSRIKDLVSKQQQLDDDEWLPEKQTLRKRAFQSVPTSSRCLAEVQKSSVVKRVAKTVISKKAKKVGGNARSRLMKKLKF